VLKIGIKDKGSEETDWIWLNQDCDSWPVFVNISMQFGGWWRVEQFLTSRLN